MTSVKSNFCEKVNRLFIGTGSDFWRPKNVHKLTLGVENIKRPHIKGGHKMFNFHKISQL